MHEHAYSRIACLHASDGLIVMSMDGLIRWANPAYCKMMGYAPAEIIGRHPLTFAPLPEERWDAAALEGFDLAAHIKKLKPREIRQNMRKDGSTFWNELAMSLHETSEGTCYAVLVCRDATASIEREQKLEATTRRLAHIAMHDALTGVANRAALARFLDKALQDANGKNARIGVLHIDLDEFKQINDTHGHAAGDAVLKATAKRLQKAIRQTDLVARVGGDEFVIVCSAVTTLDTLRDIGTALIKAANLPVPWQNGTINCRISIGAALSQPDTTDADTLLLQSDFALYDAKRSARGQITTYDSDLHQRHARAVDLQADLQDAVQNGTLSFVFQPVVGKPAGVVRGLETLVRWHHPTKGLIMPDEVIPLAQRIGVMADIDMLAMHAALDLKTKLNAWGHGNVLTSFNASSELLARSDFCDHLLSGLAFRDLSPDDVIVEVIETVVIEGNSVASPFARTIADLDAAGVFTVLDDFGRGNAGIAQLAKLAIKGVKFDKSLGMSILTDPTMPIIYKTLVGLCNDLDLRMVTEGVETAEQADALRKLGCSNIQGFLIAKPLDPDDLRPWLDHYTASAIAPAEPRRYLGTN